MFNWVYRNHVTKEAYALLKKERDELKSQLPSLLGQINEQKGVMDYTLADREQEIERLNKTITAYEDQIATLKKKNEAAEMGLSDEPVTLNSMMKRYDKLPNIAVQLDPKEQIKACYDQEEVEAAGQTTLAEKSASYYKGKSKRKK